jgi:hypothetical protein
MDAGRREPTGENEGCNVTLLRSFSPQNDSMAAESVTPNWLAPLLDGDAPAMSSGSPTIR